MTVSIKAKYFLDRNQSVLVVIDVQEKLCRAMDPRVLARLISNVNILQEVASELRIPLIITEQYPKGLGATLPALQTRATDPVLEKLTFSCCGAPAFLERLKAIGRPQVIVTGMESHVCVLQTVLELLDAQYIVHWVRDAIMSRTQENDSIGRQTAAAAGAVISSTETALFQLLRVAGTAEFKKFSKLVK